MENLDSLADGRVIAPTRRTMRHVSGESPQLARGGNQSVAEVGMPLQELAAQHNDEMYNPWPRRVPWPGVGRVVLCLNEDGADQLGEAVARPIQATLHSPQIAPRDLGDLLIALPFELPEHEHLPVVLREPLDALVDGVL